MVSWGLKGFWSFHKMIPIQRKRLQYENQNTQWLPFLLISRKFRLIFYILHFDHKLKPDQLNVKQENKTCSTCPFKFISKIWKSKSKHRTRSTTSKLNECLIQKLVHFVSLHLRILTNTCVCQIQGQVSSCLAKKFGTKIYCCPPPCRIYVVDSFNQLEVGWLTLV